MPVHTEDLEVERNDRFCVATVLEVDAPGVDADAVLEGAHCVAGVWGLAASALVVGRRARPA